MLSSVTLSREGVYVYGVSVRVAKSIEYQSASDIGMYQSPFTSCRANWGTGWGVESGECCIRGDGRGVPRYVWGRPGYDDTLHLGPGRSSRECLRNSGTAKTAV